MSFFKGQKDNILKINNQTHRSVNYAGWKCYKVVKKITETTVHPKQ